MTKFNLYINNEKNDCIVFSKCPPPSGMALPFGSLGFLTSQKIWIKIIVLSNLLILTVPDAGYSRNPSCTLNSVFTFFISIFIIKPILNYQNLVFSFSILYILQVIYKLLIVWSFISEAGSRKLFKSKLQANKGHKKILWSADYSKFVYGNIFYIFSKNIEFFLAINGRSCENRVALVKSIFIL